MLYLLALLSDSETDAGIDNPTDTVDHSSAVPAVGNPEYFEKDTNETRTAPGATVDDEGSYLTCGAPAGDYYDYNRAQMIAA